MDRKTPVNKEAGVIQSSNPISVSKNSGVGSTIGGLGTSIAGSNIGSGNGRYVGAILGSLIGSRVGHTAESKLRQQDAQALLIQINSKSHKFINTTSKTYQPGDKIWATTNSLGEPLTITPR